MQTESGALPRDAQKPTLAKGLETRKASWHLWISRNRGILAIRISGSLLKPGFWEAPALCPGN